MGETSGTKECSGSAKGDGGVGKSGTKRKLFPGNKSQTDNFSLNNINLKDTVILKLKAVIAKDWSWNMR